MRPVWVVRRRREIVDHDAIVFDLGCGHPFSVKVSNLPKGVVWIDKGRTLDFEEQSVDVPNSFLRIHGVVHPEQATSGEAEFLGTAVNGGVM